MVEKETVGKETVEEETGAADAGVGEEAGKVKVLWPVNDMGDDVSYLDNLDSRDVRTPEYQAWLAEQLKR